MEEELIVDSPLGAVPFSPDSLPEYLWTCMREQPNREALVDSETNETYTFASLMVKAEILAQNLIALGVKTGDIVTFYSTNCLEYLLTVLAVWRLGGSVALLNPMAQAGDMHRELMKTKSLVLFTNVRNAGQALVGCRGTKVKTIITKGSYPGCVSISALLHDTGSPLPSFKELAINPERDTVAILFSSGTTGLPKAVEITHRNMTVQLSFMLSIFIDRACESQIIFQPIAHIYGLTLFAAGLALVAKSLVMPQFNLERYISIAAKHKVLSLTLVPPVSVMLAKSGLIEKYDLSSVTSILNGAAPLSPDIESELNQQLGGQVLMRQCYGMTEVSSVIMAMPCQHAISKHRPKYRGSVGILMPGMECKVVDPNTGKSLGAGGRGEFRFRGATVMKGYMDDPEATADAIDKEGWLRSGDIGFYDENKCFYIVDRMKELIKYNALQVAPSELEALILTHPALADVGVIGKPDPVAGELPMAWVVVKPGHSVSEGDIKEYVSERAAPYKKLRGGVKFVEAIPKSPSGKIIRREMKRIVMEKQIQSQL